MPDPVVVIGGGMGGLATAARLARAGRDVVVLERESVVGGKVREHRQAGYRWDTGPSVITMRQVFADLFRDCGESLDDHVELVPLDPVFRCRFADGSVLDVPPGREALLEAVHGFAPADTDGFRRFLDHVATIHRVTAPVFIHDHRPTWRSFVSKGPVDLWRADPIRTMHAAISAHVRHPGLQALLGQFATWVGASPYRAPATLNVIAHVQLTEGAWYPRGGVARLADAVAALAVRAGVDIRTDHEVTGLRVDGGRVTAVEHPGGVQPASAVVSNLDPRLLYGDLLPDHPGARLARDVLSSSYLVVLLGLARAPDALTHHNLWFPADPRAAYRDVFQRDAMPRDPMIYASVTSHLDPTHAPADGANVFLLVQAPPAGGTRGRAALTWTDAGAEAAADHVLARLADHGTDLRDAACRHVIGPHRHPSTFRGAIYGGSTNQRLHVFRRPPHVDPVVRGLFHVGGTTHPGGGVPMVLLSARCVADLVLG